MKREDDSNSPVTKKNDNEKEILIVKYKKQIAANIWFQAFAQISEAWLVTKLFYLEDQVPGSHEIVYGIWLQGIGQLIEAIGVSEQLLATDNPALFKGQRTAINGDWMQSIGAAVEATGGEIVLRDSIMKDGDGFVP